MRVSVLQAAFSDKKVLVTGHSGFKGSWLTIWLTKLGAKVVGYALAPETDPSLFELAHVASRCESIIADIRDADAVLTVFRRVKPDIVFHLAAQPLVRRSYREPKETFDINVSGTINVLEAVRRTDSVRAAVMITTDKVYENREWIYGYREVDALGGYDPYSASKAAAEIAIQAYIRAFFTQEDRPIGVASTRAGNVLGGGDWAEDRILPDAVRSADADQPLQVRHPEAVRPWQHVLEPLAGYLALAARLIEDRSFAGAWNFGPLATDVMRVGELVETFFVEYGRGSWEHVPEENSTLHEAGLLKLACEKAAEVLGWKPVWDTREAVRRTAAWYRDVLHGNMDAWKRCERDIDEYVTAAGQSGGWWAQ